MRWDFARGPEQLNLTHLRLTDLLDEAGQMGYTSAQGTVGRREVAFGKTSKVSRVVMLYPAPGNTCFLSPLLLAFCSLECGHAGSGPQWSGFAWECYTIPEKMLAEVHKNIESKFMLDEVKSITEMTRDEGGGQAFNRREAASEA